MVTAILIIVGVALIAIGITLRIKSQTKEGKYVETVAEVVSVEEQSSGDDEKKSFVPTLKYKANGEEYISTSSEVNELPEIGKQYEAYYDPKNPTTLTLLKGNKATQFKVMTVVGVVLVVATIILRIFL